MKTHKIHNSLYFCESHVPNAQYCVYTEFNLQIFWEHSRETIKKDEKRRIVACKCFRKQFPLELIVLPVVYVHMNTPDKEYCLNNCLGLPKLILIP